MQIRGKQDKAHRLVLTIMSVRPDTLGCKKINTGI